MSPTIKSLEKRVQDLRHSIEARKTELAAYEQVLALEARNTGGTGLSLAAPQSAPPATVSGVKKKRHLSEEGRKRIIAATKRRWAKQRALQRGKSPV